MHPFEWVEPNYRGQVTLRVQKGSNVGGSEQVTPSGGNRLHCEFEVVRFVMKS